MTFHLVPLQGKVDHQKLVAQYCLYMLPELKSETALSLKPKITRDGKVTVLDFQSANERYGPDV